MKINDLAESFKHDVDHMSGPRVKLADTNCKTCHGRKVLYKTPDGKKHADNKKGAKKIKCTVCKGTGSLNESHSWRTRERADADTFFRVNPDSGRLQSRSILQTDTARYQTSKDEGWVQDKKQALRDAGIFRSKFDSKKWVKKDDTTGKWVEVFPYGKSDIVDEAGREWKSIGNGRMVKNPSYTPPAPRVKVTKEKKPAYDFPAIWGEVEHAVSQSIPDVDPWDYIIPNLRKKFGIDPDRVDVSRLLDKAAKVSGYKNYTQYLVDMWDSYNETTGNNEPNPWKPIDEESYYDYHASKSSTSKPSDGKTPKKEYDAHKALGGKSGADPEVMRRLGVRSE